MGKFVFEKAEIICVGTEILIGDIVNTNAQFLSAELANLGIGQYYQKVVGDNHDRLFSSIKESLERADLVILCGGLGPTDDDITKETAAEIWNRKLISHKESEDALKAYFSRSSCAFTENNLKQAMMPEGSVVFPNDCGTAPGCAIENENLNKVIIVLPGPPKEMKTMWNNYALKYLLECSNSFMISKNMNIYGMGESNVGDILAHLDNHDPSTTFATYCDIGETRIRVTSRGTDEAKCKENCDKTIDLIMQTEIGKFVYGFDTNLPVTLVNLLKKHGLKVSTAESCTGGTVASLITDISGSSEVFDGSIVTYANRIKRDFLGVNQKDLDQFGAVSSQVATQMSVGIMKTMDADIGIGITGIAGPTGGSPEKPVGLVYISVSTKENTFTNKYIFNGDRQKVRLLSAKKAISMAINAIKEK